MDLKKNETFGFDLCTNKNTTIDIINKVTLHYHADKNITRKSSTDLLSSAQIHFNHQHVLIVLIDIQNQNENFLSCTAAYVIIKYKDVCKLVKWLFFLI